MERERAEAFVHICYIKMLHLNLYGPSFNPLNPLASGLNNFAPREPKDRVASMYSFANEDVVLIKILLTMFRGE